MTHQQKVEHLIAELGRKGIRPATVAPPMFRLLWALGIRVPPPLFLGFFTLALWAGILFGALCGACMWLVQWRFWPVSGGSVVVTSLCAGMFFGLCMAGHHRWKFSHLRLPPWKDYPKD